MQPTIIIVDDDEDHRYVMVETLTNGLSHSCKILEAVDGLQAWTLLLEEKEAIIISDIDMPGMTGLDLLKAIKAIRPNVKVILVSGGNVSEEQVLQDGAEALFIKPYDSQDLVRAINELLEDDDFN